MYFEPDPFNLPLTPALTRGAVTSRALPNFQTYLC